MKESDYIIATNLAKYTAAINILRSITKDDLKDYFLPEIVNKIQNRIDIIYNEIDVETNEED